MVRLIAILMRPDGRVATETRQSDSALVGLRAILTGLGSDLVINTGKEDASVSISSFDDSVHYLVRRDLVGVGVCVLGRMNEEWCFLSQNTPC